MHVQVKVFWLASYRRALQQLALTAEVIQTKGQLKYLKWHCERGVGCYWNETFRDRHFLQWMTTTIWFCLRNRNLPSIQGYLSVTWWTQHHQVTLKGISTKQDFCFSPFTSIDTRDHPLSPIPQFYLRIGLIPRNESLMWWPIWLRWPWHKQMMVCLVVVAREWPWNVVELPCSMAFNGEGSWDWAPSRLQRIISKSGAKSLDTTITTTVFVGVGKDVKWGAWYFWWFGVPRSGWLVSKSWRKLISFCVHVNLVRRNGNPTISRANSYHFWGFIGLNDGSPSLGFVCLGIARSRWSTKIHLHPPNPSKRKPLSTWNFWNPLKLHDQNKKYLIKSIYHKFGICLTYFLIKTSHPLYLGEDSPSMFQRRLKAVNFAQGRWATPVGMLSGGESLSFWSWGGLWGGSWVTIWCAIDVSLFVYLFKKKHVFVYWLIHL